MLFPTVVPAVLLAPSRICNLALSLSDLVRLLAPGVSVSSIVFVVGLTPEPVHIW